MTTTVKHEGTGKFALIAVNKTEADQKTGKQSR